VQRIGGKIFIAGYYGFRNVGDEAVLSAMISSMRSLDPDLLFVVTSEEPEETEREHGVSCVRWDDYQAVVTSIMKSDLVLLGGGGLLNSYLEYDPSLFLVPGHRLFSVFIFGVPVLARALGKPCMIYSVGASTIEPAEAREHVRFAVDCCSEVTVRTKRSLEVLRQLGCQGQISVTGDAAFCLSNEEIDITDYVGRNVARPLVGVSIRDWEIRSDQDRTEEAVAEALTTFTSRNGGTCVFLPFDTGMSAGELSADDLAIDRVIKRAGPGLNHVALKGYHKPGVVSAIISKCDLVMGMRLHSVILSIKNGIPFAALQYDPKVTGMLRDSGMTGYGLDIDGITGPGLLQVMERAYAHRGWLRPHLVTVAGEMRRASLRSASLAMDLLKRVGEAPVGGLPLPVVAHDFQPLLWQTTGNLVRYAGDASMALGDIPAGTAKWSRELRMAIDGGDFSAAVEAALLLLRREPENPEWNYLYAFCLQMLRRAPEEALKCYGRALELGFPEFWVRYNRGTLRASVGDVEGARDDLAAAIQLDGEHDGARQLYDKLIQGIGRT
jgi:polysaccharide pyruvyl transferase CsaB